MPYEIKQRDSKYYVVNAEDQKIRGTYDNEDAAEDRMDELTFREHVRSKLDRIPVAEMTAEEKAAAYDKMITEKNTAPPDPHVPPKIDPTTPPVERKSRYFNSEN
jgi:hypothetical protein